MRAHGALLGLATKPLAFALGWLGPITVLLLARTLLGSRARRLIG